MTALNKQALIAKIKKQTESFDTVVLKEDEANALLDELESQQTFQQAFFRQSLMYDVVAEAYEEAKEQIAKDVEIKARLCLESNSLFDRLRAAEKRIAELEAKLANPVLLPKTNGYWNEQEKAYEDAITLARRQIRLAGFRCEGDE
ncbi:hypothetical protein ACONVS_004918 [Salmonella enterica]|uniref:hypothetical protein n=1 Tax=Salmonella enterica TaxID=28901 RepID=UPI000ACFC6F9|nr:hypothetical protein [Salmonella enterica]